MAAGWIAEPEQVSNLTAGGAVSLDAGAERRQALAKNKNTTDLLGSINANRSDVE